MVVEWLLLLGIKMTRTQASSACFALYVVDWSNCIMLVPMSIILVSALPCIKVGQTQLNYRDPSPCRDNNASQQTLTNA